jgi:hypothetical protein
MTGRSMRILGGGGEGGHAALSSAKIRPVRHHICRRGVDRRTIPGRKALLTKVPASLHCHPLRSMNFVVRQSAESTRIRHGTCKDAKVALVVGFQVEGVEETKSVPVSIHRDQ